MKIGRRLVRELRPPDVSFLGLLTLGVNATRTASEASTYYPGFSGMVYLCLYVTASLANSAVATGVACSGNILCVAPATESFV